MNFFSSNTNISDEMSMMHTLWMYAVSMNYSARSEMGYIYRPPRNLYLGGTPLNDAIIAMMELVPKFKKKTGVQKVNTIFLTDGASNKLDGIYDYRLITDGERKGTHEKIDRSCVAEVFPTRISRRDRSIRKSIACAKKNNKENY